MSTETDHVTLISVNRPLTHSARKALSEYTIAEVRQTKELGHWTEVDVETCPPDELLDRHELKRDDPTGGAEPDAVYESTSGKRIEIYPDTVFEGNRQLTIDPKEAKSRAEKAGWEKLSG